MSKNTAIAIVASIVWPILCILDQEPWNPHVGSNFFFSGGKSTAEMLKDLFIFGIGPVFIYWAYIFIENSRDE